MNNNLVNESIDRLDDFLREFNEFIKEFESNYSVSWKDKEGNKWESDFLTIEEASTLFNKLVDDPDDDDQVECSLWSFIDCKNLVRYSNLEHKFYY